MSPGVSSSSRSGINRRTRVDGMWLGGEDLHAKGSFIHKPSQGWLHPDKKIVGQGASYIVRVSTFKSRFLKKKSKLGSQLTVKPSDTLICLGDID